MTIWEYAVLRAEMPSDGKGADFLRKWKARVLANVAEDEREHPPVEHAPPHARIAPHPKAKPRAVNPEAKRSPDAAELDATAERWLSEHGYR